MLLASVNKVLKPEVLDNSQAVNIFRLSSDLSAPMVALGKLYSKEEPNSESCAQKKVAVAKYLLPVLPVISLQLIFCPFMTYRALFCTVSFCAEDHLDRRRVFFRYTAMKL